ncbi:hypothetical protein WICPIJ_001865 [Wickerhamomyces pijperi]|uniref:Uncharacterized protein n=1 Tax=Wickerhamomyces pijperi TaxID=599730 RepID=A0A9P8QCH6_WICPI|nr:hypothetical protein WICPIJ_001865 [Wickerhamomyces pijperi]
MRLEEFSPLFELDTQDSQQVNGEPMSQTQSGNITTLSPAADSVSHEDFNDSDSTPSSSASDDVFSTPSSSTNDSFSDQETSNIDPLLTGVVPMETELETAQLTETKTRKRSSSVQTVDPKALQLSKKQSVLAPASNPPKFKFFNFESFNNLPKLSNPDGPIISSKITQFTITKICSNLSLNDTFKRSLGKQGLEMEDLKRVLIQMFCPRETVKKRLTVEEQYQLLAELLGSNPSNGTVDDPSADKETSYKYTTTLETRETHFQFQFDLKTSYGYDSGPPTSIQRHLASLVDVCPLIKSNHKSLVSEAEAQRLFDEGKKPDGESFTLAEDHEVSNQDEIQGAKWLKAPRWCNHWFLYRPAFNLLFWRLYVVTVVFSGIEICYDPATTSNPVEIIRERIRNDPNLCLNQIKQRLTEVKLPLDMSTLISQFWRFEPKQVKDKFKKFSKKVEVTQFEEIFQDYKFMPDKKSAPAERRAKGRNMGMR